MGSSPTTDIVSTPLCKTCFEDNKDKFYIRNDTNRHRLDICKKCFNANKIEQSRLRKVKAVEYKGSACERCTGVFIYPSVFDFHHIDQNSKSHSSRGVNFQWSWDRIQDEIDKCLMLCANCHRIEHEGLSNRGQEASLASSYVVKKYLSNKLRIIEYFGSCCKHCNLVTNHYSVYDIHHLDPSIKEFSMHTVRKLSWNNALNEISKCILLCANCHRIEHATK